MKKVFFAIAALLALAIPAQAAETYTGNWPKAGKFTLLVDGSNVRYCVIRFKNGCLRSRVNNVQTITFRRGKKDVDGSWGVTFTKNGNCYNAKYVVLIKGKREETNTKAC